MVKKYEDKRWTAQRQERRWSSRHVRLVTGRRLREWRLRQHLSQVDVARHSGISQGALSNYENGRGNISLTTVLDIADTLGVPVAVLIDRDELFVEVSAAG